MNCESAISRLCVAVGGDTITLDAVTLRGMLNYYLLADWPDEVIDRELRDVVGDA